MHNKGNTANRMEKKIVFFAASIIIAGCGGKIAEQSKSKQDTVLYYPYDAIYSAGFEPGKSIYLKEVLEIWRQYETGNLSDKSGSFADTIRIILPDAILYGQKDSVLSLFKKRRSIYSDVQSYVDAWMPVKAKETNEDLVFIWGRQDCTGKK